MSTKEGRPGRSTRERPSEARNHPTLSVPDAVDYATLEGAFCVVVEVHPDRYRRRVFMTLKAAEAHVNRARGRGQSCRIVLAELRPLYILSGTAQDVLGGAA